MIVHNVFQRTKNKDKHSLLSQALKVEISYFSKSCGHHTSTSPPVKSCFTEDCCSCRSSRLNPRKQASNVSSPSVAMLGSLRSTPVNNVRLAQPKSRPGVCLHHLPHPHPRESFFILNMFPKPGYSSIFNLLYCVDSFFSTCSDEHEFILGIQLADVRSNYVLSLYWATATATSTG